MVKQKVPKEISDYLKQIGARGGKKSRRTLTPEQAKKMIETRESRKVKTQPVSCKIGTVPKLMYVDRRCTIAVGKVIRVREHSTQEWFQVIVERINPDGYFFASKL